MTMSMTFCFPIYIVQMADFLTSFLLTKSMFITLHGVNVLVLFLLGPELHYLEHVLV